MTDIAKKLRDMHALAAGSCDPELNRALLEAATEIERLREALASCESWMDRWAAHVGSCKGWAECTCGLAAVSHEAHVALYEPDQALQELTDQAQALDMGYGQKTTPAESASYDVPLKGHCGQS